MIIPYLYIIIIPIYNNYICTTIFGVFIFIDEINPYQRYIKINILTFRVYIFMLFLDLFYIIL